ncbi:MAG: gamma-glutamyltransferase [Chloroflexi bacterium]|nr:gamma-glutamyltransferase [Chloroflexota bacterium]MBP8060128.1 gamma-glutamyltransferase [Chloroflexota bacterium]
MSSVGPTHGVISAGDRLTAAAGAEMLRLGGNAVDAAVAAAFASFIAESGVVHLGGSGIAQVYHPQQGGAVYDFFSNMPGLKNLGMQAPFVTVQPSEDLSHWSASTQKPSEDSFSRGTERLLPFLDFQKTTIDFGATTQDFYLGRGSVAVPGNIAGLCQMAADYGRLSLRQILGPAIRYAREGVNLSPLQVGVCELLRPLYTHTPEMAAIFQRGERMICPEDTLFIPHLAETLIQLAETGAEMARTGWLAQALLQDQAENGGLLTTTDLQSYNVNKAEPIALTYRDFTVRLPLACSAGGVLTAFALTLLRDFPVGQWPHGSVMHLRLLYEVMAAAARARPQWETWRETMTVEASAAAFLADDFIESYRREVRDALSHPHRIHPAREEESRNHTSHLSVMDAEGWVVSLTTTAGESAGYVLPNTGYIPNNMLGEEDLHPQGFHRRPAGERIPTMMTPTLVLQEGQVRLVLGSGGSIRIRSAILQVLINVLDYDLPLDEAVNRARVHLENGVLQCELGVDAAAMDQLEKMGYPVNRWATRNIYFGGAHSVARGADGRLAAAGDSRRGGAVAMV